jgi:hypothetical protein
VFDSEGRVRLPDIAVVDAPRMLGQATQRDAAEPDPMRHQSPLPFEPTRFDRDWVSDDETLLGEWVRRLSKESSYDTKYGTRISCKAFLFLMACGWGPTPRVSIEELKGMRANPPLPRSTLEDPFVEPDE